jgi:DNA-binding NarL/FixJ family response regulator
MVDVRDILRRLAAGEKVKRVARALGFCPKTIRRYRDEAIRRGLTAAWDFFAFIILERHAI